MGHLAKEVPSLVKQLIVLQQHPGFETWARRNETHWAASLPSHEVCYFYIGHVRQHSTPHPQTQAMKNGP